MGTESKWERIKENVITWIAWHLPKVLVKWCFVRVSTLASVEEYADKVMGDISVIDALDCWEGRSRDYKYSLPDNRIRIESNGIADDTKITYASTGKPLVGIQKIVLECVGGDIWKAKLFTTAPTIDLVAELQAELNVLEETDG
jgi:hypothetical protein